MPSLGDVIDRTFRVNRKIGQGAAGDVFEVELVRPWADLAPKTRLCLKWYRDSIFERESAQIVYARRIREATTGGTVNHPNLVRTFDSSEFWLDGVPRYLVMELLTGTTLDDYVKSRKPRDPETFYAIATNLLGALKALHSARVIHRDVKPSNVVITQVGEAVLLDLGVVRATGLATMTKSSSFLGTIRYAAPEWLFDGRATRASDVYAACATLSLLLNGHEPFPSSRRFSNLVLAVSREEVEYRLHGCDVALTFAGHALRRGTSRDPKRRPTLPALHRFFVQRERSPLWKSIRADLVRKILPTSLRHQNEFFDAIAPLGAPAIDAAVVAGDSSIVYATSAARGLIWREANEWAQMLKKYDELWEEEGMDIVSERASQLEWLLGDIDSSSEIIAQITEEFGERSLGQEGDGPIEGLPTNA